MRYVLPFGLFAQLHSVTIGHAMRRAPERGDDGRGEMQRTCLCCTARGLLFSTGGSRKMVTCLMTAGGVSFATTTTEEWSGKQGLMEEQKMCSIDPPGYIIN